jgi:hypothetical protein
MKPMNTHGGSPDCLICFGTGYEVTRDGIDDVNVEPCPCTFEEGEEISDKDKAHVEYLADQASFE